MRHWSPLLASIVVLVRSFEQIHHGGRGKLFSAKEEKVGTEADDGLLESSKKMNIL